ncbi:Nucleolar GTP-binding protein 1 [Dimargaris cristalligena]|uniref:Nucleolar GTP-binding protein 1 n=1 Tax=Dimargaris cristalligena TaxID=215637 RepID=A0A4P9ZUZ1_9FUNG|nr:Nucleolar GTP-binding protein 1 [Dimargaris cristalligena]RKP36731.1 P-loop containing nucleoside triphosphate hydrolase protein [Dimargaris cristalligena]|eukprot:RKP36731.1 P-loop containing nucleoside triphosphate hydrolase protein [Dimargaris cristalligena]
MSLYNFKKIQVVPSATDFLDIILSKTQRKTPTVIHPGYKISRIRQFYMRKVKFTQDAFEEKLNLMLEDFPKVDNIHPFYADLMNILYDKDHYKLALGQLNTARHLIGSVAKDYVRLLKFGDSLYRCKQLKKAALGRMATIMKRQKDSLAYLEQVRQHLARLPSIDPTTRTLIVCGYPNVGKSSFMNKVTRANVDVQPYAFTTKSLFVGHMDYKYLRWQVIDTPGILDHPLEDRNTIEMQSITALAHLRACILFFIDLSEQCGFSIADQVNLFNSIKPLFANKPTQLVISKIDTTRLEDLDEANQTLVRDLLKDNVVQMAQLSSHTEEGVMETRNAACERLLATRVDSKLRNPKIHEVLNKLHLAQPAPRGDVSERPPCIPDAVRARKKYDSEDPKRPRLERDIEMEEGGPGVYSVDLKKHYMLKDDDWKYDTIPEIMNGKNVADFVDPQIEEQLEALEREEERLIEQGMYESPDDSDDSEDERIRETAQSIRDRKIILLQEKRLKRSMNSAPLPKRITNRLASNTQLQAHLSSLGINETISENVARSRSRPRALTGKRARSPTRAEALAREASVSSRKQQEVASRGEIGLRGEAEKRASAKLKRLGERSRNLEARQGESDRRIPNLKPKHLFAGKRGSGKTDRR